MQNDPRPTNASLVDLLNFRWTIIALVSIAHRITGVVLFVGTGFGLYALDMSLSSEAGFRTLTGMLGSPVGQFILWGLLSALACHFVAGIKHLLLDMGLGETIEGARRASILAVFFTLVLIALAGLWVF